MDFANTQIALFEKLSSKLLLNTNKTIAAHSKYVRNCNLKTHNDMVRLVGLYGVSNDAEEQNNSKM
jgi:hypothetical protein